MGEHFGYALLAIIILKKKVYAWKFLKLPQYRIMLYAMNGVNKQIANLTDWNFHNMKIIIESTKKGEKWRLCLKTVAVFTISPFHE